MLPAVAIKNEPELEYVEYEAGEQSVDFGSYPEGSDTEACIKQMQLELEIRAKFWMEDISKKAQEKGSIMTQIDNSNPPQVFVGVGESGKPYASVQCFLCPKIVRICYVRSTKEGALNWVFKRGNYNKHIIRNHKEYNCLNKENK